jgi:Cytochrome c554 and c-prime
VEQRYFKRVDGDYYVFPAQWDVTHKAWKPYFVKDDWWAPLYPPDNFARPTSALCDGCHAVNYDIATRSPTEWNVGCEKCHGPGGDHAKDPATAAIVNPARLDYVAAADVCIQCHSQGRPLTNPIDGNRGRRTGRTRRRWRSTRITGPGAPATSASAATCRRSRRLSAT